MIDKIILINELIKRKEIYEFLDGPYIGCLIVCERASNRETHTSVFKLANVYDEIELNENIEDFFNEEMVWVEELLIKLETTSLHMEKLSEWNKNPNNEFYTNWIRLATNEEIKTFVNGKKG